MAEWWNGRMAEWEWHIGGIAHRWNGTSVEWHIGGMAHWWNGTLMEWHNGMTFSRTAYWYHIGTVIFCKHHYTHIVHL
jgi:hypothetical protein